MAVALGAGGGNFNVTARGTSGSLSHSATSVLDAQDFSLTVSPWSQTVATGGTATVVLTAAGLGGFNGSINLAVYSAPSCGQISYSPYSITPGGSATFQFNTTSCSPSGYGLGIRGCYGTLCRYIGATVYAGSGPDFTITASPNSQSVAAGGNTSYTIGSTSYNGFSGTIYLPPPSLPSGVTASFGSSYIAAGGSTTLTVYASAGAAVGTYTLGVTGQSGSLTRQAAPFLTISTTGISVGVTPPAITLTAGQAQQITANVSGSSNTAVTWSLSGLGTLTGATSNTVQYSAPGTLSGNSTATITATSQANGTTTGTAQIALDVPATFTITTSPPGLSLVVDGVTCTSPCTYQWTTASGHTLATTAAQAANGAQYLFSYWSDGWPLSHTIPDGASATTYTANFTARIPISTAGIWPSALEVNLGPLPVDLYDGSAINTNNSPFPACSSNWVVQACMQNLLSNYAIQGVTGVRFQLAVTRSPSTAFDSNGTFQQSWITNLTNFFGDLAAFGITNIAPTTSWDDFHQSSNLNLNYDNAIPPNPCEPIPTDGCSGYSNCTTSSDAPVPNAPGRRVSFSHLLPYGIVPGPDADGKGLNSAYACSPINTTFFWGWSHHYSLIDQVAAAAQSKGLTIEEFDLENEVSLHNFTVQARLIYDNNPQAMTAVLETLGPALSNHNYAATVLTVSSDTDMPGSTTPSLGPSNPYPCASVYGDAAQLLGSSELLAAVGGALIGWPPYIAWNGAMACDGSANQGCGPVGGDGWFTCATRGMIYIPSGAGAYAQATRTVIDMHAKPCLAPNGPCDPSADATIPARDTFTQIQDFLLCRGLTGSRLTFGETWSNSSLQCNGYPDGPNPLANPVGLTQETIHGYLQSCLYSSSPGCPTPVGCVAGSPNPANVAFRPWANATSGTSVCESPLNIGAPNGPFKCSTGSAGNPCQ
jgi:hypothetical protein